MNKELWNKVAESYKSESVGLWQSEAIAIKELFVDKSEPVLVVGGGTGRVAFMLAKLGFEVFCTDLSPEMIKFAEEERRFYSSLVNEKIKFSTLDITKGTMDLGKFKYVFFPFHGIDHISPRKERLNAILNIEHILRDSESVALVVSRNTWDYVFSFKIDLLKNRFLKQINRDETCFYNHASGLQEYYVYSNFGSHEKKWIENNTNLFCQVKRRNSFAYFPTIKTSSYFYLLTKK